MKTKETKPNPKRILGYLMAFAMVFFTTNVSGQCTSNTSSYGSGVASSTSAVTISLVTIYQSILLLLALLLEYRTLLIFKVEVFLLDMLLSYKQMVQLFMGLLR